MTSMASHLRDLRAMPSALRVVTGQAELGLLVNQPWGERRAKQYKARNLGQSGADTARRTSDSARRREDNPDAGEEGQTSPTILM